MQASRSHGNLLPRNQKRDDGLAAWFGQVHRGMPIMLNVDEMIALLIERQLIDRDWIIHGELVIRCASRRNRNLRVEGPDGMGCFIKQSDPLAFGGQRTLGHEASFLEHCRNQPALAGIAEFLPRIIHRDRDHAFHALELLNRATPLLSFQAAHEDDAFPNEPSRALGEALAGLHRSFSMSESRDNPSLAWLPRGIPWSLGGYTMSPARLATVSPAQGSVLRIIEEQELSDQLVHLGAEWRPETVIHGDIKFDNVLVRPARGGVDAALDLFIVDWEFVQIGDPAWDLAGALHDYLVLWISSMPLGPDLSPEQMINQAAYPLSTLQQAVRALWEGYLQAPGLSPQGADELVSRAVHFAAARLVHAAYERSAFEQTLPAGAVILLQLSSNIMANPELARIQLFGIPRRTVPC
jgi:Phosphotransferase enzyme family